MINALMVKNSQNNYNPLPKFGRDAPWLWRPNFRDVGSALSAIYLLENEMNQRYTRLKSANVLNVDNYNQIGSEPIHRIAIVFSNSTDLSGEKEQKSLFESTCQRICAMGKAVGIHLILERI
ncbi:cell division FtsK/SpoIIIE [Fischerella sp. NIES-4106]|jgi:DNA segregation ATPase FtsK/SpoIIIE-like protein|nr:cell division FtsK/SpoIIIE [Fischerella sp. NIES-4106]